MHFRDTFIINIIININDANFTVCVFIIVIPIVNKHKEKLVKHQINWPYLFVCSFTEFVKFVVLAFVFAQLQIIISQYILPLYCSC